jgi:predicted flap endonuclease-1-like 5' DNA nuclease
VAERDTTIERLQSQNRTQAELKDGEIGRLKAEQHRKDQDVERLTARTGEIQPLLAKLQQRQSEVDRLHHELQVISQSKEDETSRLEAELDELKSARSELAARDSDIHRLQKEMQSLAARKDARIEELHQRLSELDALRGSLLQRDEALKQWQQRFDALERNKTAEISALSDQLKAFEDVKKKLDFSRTETERCEREKLSLRQQLSRLEENAKTVEALPAGQLYRRPAEKDDLKKIKGIGSVLEKTLNRLGVTAFAQIGRFSPEDIDRVSSALKVFPGRIVRDDWIGGARKAYREKYGKNLD